MSVAYINYHRQPRVNFTSIREYNEKFNTSVPENKIFEQNFQVAWTRARTETDPNEFIQHQFDTENMGILSSLAKRAKKVASGAKAAVKKGVDKYKDKKKKKKQREKALDKLIASGNDDGLKPSLDDFLDDYDETNYEEVIEEKAAASEQKRSVHDEIKDFVAETAKDSESYARDLSHIVHFNTKSSNMGERLMKGRDRYMKRLKAYVDGDKTVKVRMMNNKEVLVSELSPNIASLQEMLNSKSGAPRFCKCDC